MNTQFKEIRINAGLTQKQVARRAKTHATTVSALELGKIGHSSPAARRVINALNSIDSRSKRSALPIRTDHWKSLYELSRQENQVLRGQNMILREMSLSG